VPLTGRQARRRRWGLAALGGTAAAAWAATIAIDMANVEDNAFFCALAVAGIATMATLQYQLILMLARLLGGVNDRLDKAQQSMARLYAGQPDPAPTPQPWPGLRSVDGDDAPALQPGRRAIP